MSEENVEIVRQALEKWNRGDYDGPRLRRLTRKSSGRFRPGS